MKKSLFGIALLAALAMSSCGNRAKVEKVEQNPQQLVAKIENCSNPDSLKIYVEAARDYASKLADENKLDSAQAYINCILPIVEKKDPSMVDSFKSVEGVLKAAEQNGVTKAKTEAGEAVDSAISAVKNKATQTVEDSKEAINNAIENATVKTANAVKESADKVTDAIK